MCVCESITSRLDQFVSDVLASMVSLQTLKEKLSSFTSEGEEGNTARDEEEGGSEESSLTAVRSSLDDIIVLCHQSSQSLNQQQREVILLAMHTSNVGQWSSYTDGEK